MTAAFEDEPGRDDERADAIESWACEAYGKDLADKMGGKRVCFFPHRPCVSAAECTNRMTVERQQTFRKIQELSVADPLFADLAEEFPTPDTLLGGPASRPQSGT